MDDYRRHLYEALHAASRDYDQAILTLAAAALGISVTFAHDITPIPAPGTVNILLGAWLSLIVALIAIVISFLTSERDLRGAIAALDRGDTTPRPRTRAAVWTGRLNWAAGALLVLGLSLLAWYARANL